MRSCTNALIRRSASTIYAAVERRTMSTRIIFITVITTIQAYFYYYFSPEMADNNLRNFSGQYFSCLHSFFPIFLYDIPAKNGCDVTISLNTFSAVSYFHFAPIALATFIIIFHDGSALRFSPFIHLSNCEPNLSRRLIANPSAARSFSSVATADESVAQCHRN